MTEGSPPPRIRPGATSPLVRAHLRLLHSSQGSERTPVEGQAGSVIAKVELLGFVPDTILMHPLDWEAIEPTTSSTGEFLLDNSPVERSARHLWCAGGPVDGAGYRSGRGDVAGAYGPALDREFDFECTRVGDDFEQNCIRARYESRADRMVLRPTGVVKGGPGGRVSRVIALSHAIESRWLNRGARERRRLGPSIWSNPCCPIRWRHGALTHRRASARSVGQDGLRA